MKINVVLAIVSLVALVQAHPLIIVNTKITEIRAVTPDLQARQGFLDSLTSILGLGEGETSTVAPPAPAPAPTKATQSAITLPPPATVGPSQPSSTSSDDDDDDDDSSTTASSTSSSSSTASSSTASSSSASTPTAISTTKSSATSASPTATASTIPSPDSNQGSGISSGGIAVAVLMILLVIAVTAWLIFKFHPKSQAWWAAREERKYRERSYRDNIDNKPTPARRQTLRTFFAPSTAHLGGGQQIRRKPVNWGEATPPVPQKAFLAPPTPKPAVSTAKPAAYYDSEKIAITEDAAPMGFNAEPLGTIMRFSYIPPVQQSVSPMSVAREPLDRLPPVSPMSLKPMHSTRRDRDLPELPPVPALPGIAHAKRGSDGVFRL